MSFPPTYEVSFWFRNVLVPVDGSANSMRALDLAIDFAMRYGSKITVINVCSNECEEVEKKVEERVSDKVKLSYKKVKLDLTTSSIANEILNEMNANTYDAVILGARGSSVNNDINIGSVALSIGANAITTVILVR
ncbi:universal stress protein A [Sulfolobales archaeon HS-7]|nr:universal stress protein A [Sulfolobales archaeon HS-7]